MGYSPVGDEHWGGVCFYEGKVYGVTLGCIRADYQSRRITDIVGLGVKKALCKSRHDAETRRTDKLSRPGSIGVMWLQLLKFALHTAPMTRYT